MHLKAYLTPGHVSFQTSWVFTWRVSAHISFHTTTECNTHTDRFVNKHYSKICQILLHQDKVHAGCFPTSALQIGPAHSLACAFNEITVMLMTMTLD